MIEALAEISLRVEPKTPSNIHQLPYLCRSKQYKTPKNSSYRGYNKAQILAKDQYLQTARQAILSHTTKPAQGARHNNHRRGHERPEVGTNAHKGYRIAAAANAIRLQTHESRPDNPSAYAHKTDPRTKSVERGKKQKTHILY